jgi:hypothetical protein
MSYIEEFSTCEYHNCSRIFVASKPEYVFCTSGCARRGAKRPDFKNKRSLPTPSSCSLCPVRFISYGPAGQKNSLCGHPDLTSRMHSAPVLDVKHYGFCPYMIRDKKKGK